MRSEQEILAVADGFLRDEVTPKAQILDRDPTHLREVLRRMCDLELMALKRPGSYGGPDLSSEGFRHFQEQIARTSGALAFLQTQHQSAVGMIANSENEGLKAEYLPKMGNGGRLVGIGFSQLRRAGPPLMRAKETEGGYVLDGHVPWVTGWSFYPEFMVGAALPDGRAVFGVVPLVDNAPDNGEGILRVSEPMQLAAMGSAMTVTVDFRQFYLPEEKVAFIRPQGWIQHNDMINIALQTQFAFGCAQAALDILLNNAERKNLCFLQETYEALLKEFEDCRKKSEDLRDVQNEESTGERLSARAWAIELMGRCALAGVTSSSGAANSLDHPAQRVYREALVFTVSAQTGQIMEATLKRLVRGT